jgi:hypothetical protein
VLTLCNLAIVDHILVTHGPAAVAAVSIEYALRSCTRGALLLYPSATVCDLAILPSTVKVRFISSFQHLCGLSIPTSALNISRPVWCVPARPWCLRLTPVPLECIHRT